MSKKDIENQTEENQDKAPVEPVAPKEPLGTEPAPKELTPEEKLAELNDKYLRLYADFENYRKRMTKERVELIKFASEDTFKQIIPVLDDFERALKSMNEKSDLNTIKQGNELIYNKFKNILTQNGLHEMKAADAPFDPEIHDAVTNVPAPSADKKGKVIEVVEKGYWLNGKVIRHAKVVVGQ